MSLQERVEKYKLNMDRADIIDVSADIYLRILNWANINTILSPDNSGLKDGMLQVLFKKFHTK
jgi:exopolyphosphatase/guanosine-5'-triphosphate,3'-diphosphate pyrophosphatase